MLILRNIAFYVVFYVGTVFLLLTVGAAGLVAPRAVPSLADWWSGFHRGCARRLLGITVRVEGDIPEGLVLIALKHESFFEAIDLPTLLPHPVIFAKIELMRLPLWGRGAQAYGLIGVERDQGAKALRHMLASARRLTADGRPLAIFPEGTRVPHGQEPGLQAGFAGIYKLLGLPVVPVALDSGLLYHRRWKRGGTVTYRFGEVIPAGLPRAEAEERVRAAINALNRGNALHRDAG